MKLYYLPPLLLAAASAANIPHPSGKKNKSGKKSKSGFHPNERFQPFTPAYMFAIALDQNNARMYVTDKDAFIYQFASLFGDGEDDTSDCNSIGCMYAYFSFATKGKKTSDTTWSVEVASKMRGNVSFICPLETMAPSVSGSCLSVTNIPSALSTTSTSASFTKDINGPTALIRGDCSGGAYLLEMICTGTADEIDLIARYSEDDSPGFDSRPYNDAAIMMTVDGLSTFWTADSKITTFEVIGIEEESDGNACSIMGCSYAFEVSVYLRGPNPHYGEVAFVSSDEDYEFLCPRGDMIITLTPFCDGFETMWNSEPKYFGAHVESGSITCLGVETVSVECALPQS